LPKRGNKRGDLPKRENKRRVLPKRENKGEALPTKRGNKEKGRVLESLNQDRGCGFSP